MNWLTDNAKGGFAMDAIRAVVHLVDEDAEVRETLRAILEPNGYDVRCHGSAADFLKQWPMGGPGCVLLDVRMPGPSGLDLQLALAHRPDALPVVFLSGGGEIPLSVLAIRRSAADFLPKHAPRERLLASVSNAVQRSQAQQALDDRRRQIRARFNAHRARARGVRTGDGGSPQQADRLGAVHVRAHGQGASRERDAEVAGAFGRRAGAHRDPPGSGSRSRSLSNGVGHVGNFSAT